MDVCDHIPHHFCILARLIWNTQSSHLSWNDSREQFKTGLKACLLVSAYLLIGRASEILKLKLKLNKALDENSSLSYGTSLPYGFTQCYLPPDTSERALP